MFVSWDDLARARVEYRAIVRDPLLLARRYGVDALALALLVAMQVEIWAAPLAGSRATLSVCAVFASVPLLLRRRAPLVAPLAVFAALAVTSLLEAQGLYDSTFFFFGALLAAWVVGESNPNRQGVVGLVAAEATVVFVTRRFPDEGAGDYFWVSLFFAAAWLAGFTVGHRAQQAREAEERLALADARRRADAALAVADERARIARELHDVVAHSISVMTVQAAGVRRLLREDQQREREALQTVEETGREALTEMRRLLGILRGANQPADLAPQPGLARLEALVQQARDAGLPVELSVEGEPYPVAAGLDLSAYRVVQEALTNVIKHAGPARATVVVRYEPDAIALEIANDGRGNGEGEGARQGLAGMRERVAFYGGTLEAGSVDGGRGYAVRARIPVGGEGNEWLSAS
ncbi:MAG TPA: sensor histidine kinase [Gaiellaceae bacterium]|nr:sensor histidine kinase [Gaiellaceae bacterium]